MVRWQIQEAKNRLSELVRKARCEGPQMITLHGRDAVVVLAAAEFKRIAPRGDLADRFAGRALAVDAAVAETWGQISGAWEARGTSLPVIDALIAATGPVHGLVVVTRNVLDLERCGARCENSWE